MRRSFESVKFEFFGVELTYIQLLTPIRGLLKFAFFARRRPTMVGGAGPRYAREGAYHAPYVLTAL